MQKKTNQRRWLFIIIVLAVAGGAYVVLHQPAAEQGVDAAAVMTVSVVQPKQETLGHQIHASGLVVAREDVVVTADLADVRITSVLVDEGKWVKKGQPLAQLDPGSLKNQLAQLSAEYKEAQLSYQRVEKIKNSGAVSASEIDTRRAAMDGAKAQLNEAELKIQQATIVAPAAGLVYERKARIGELVGGNDPLFRIAEDGKTELEADVSEADLLTLKTGQDVSVTIAGQSKSLAGKIRLISPRVDNATRTVKLRIALPPKPEAPIGSFAEAAIATTQSSGLALPQTALGLDAGASMIWLVGEDHKVHALPVTVNFRAGGEVLVSGDGLGPDSQVIAKAGAFLHEGDIVAIAAPAEAK